MDPITLFIVNLNIPILTSIGALLDNDLIFMALILGCAVIFENGKKRNLVLVSLVCIFLIGFLLKIVIHQPRPCLVVPSKIECPSSFSFPSNHSLVSFALVAALWKKPQNWLFALFAIFVAFTRIYLGVHTFFDVLGGAIIGASAYLLIQIVYQKLPVQIKSSFGAFLE